jgi:D-inositol-3-phosphate glycosyltransferase
LQSGYGSTPTMRVVVLSFHTSPLTQPGTGDGGGMNVYVRELSTALARAGVECDVMTRASSPADARVVFVEPGFRVHHIVAGPLAPVPKEDLRPLVPAFADAVRDRMAEDGIAADLLHANYWLSAEAGHTLKHVLDVPLAITFHTLARVKSETNDFEPEERALSEEAAIGCCDVILANTTVEAEQLIRLYGADPYRIEEVPLGVDHAFFSPGSQAGARAALKLDDRPLLLFVGRLQSLKGADLAIEALAASHHRDARLLLCGGPSGVNGQVYVDELRTLAKRLGVADRLVWVDPKPHHLLSTYYRAADAVLVPSRSESFGLVALEASACGVPVIAADVGGLATIIDHGRTGFLVDGRDPSSWAMRIDAVLDDPALASALGAAAADRSRRYAWSTTAARLRRLYNDLAARALVQCG